jgi:hypothetical protein
MCCAVAIVLIAVLTMGTVTDAGPKISVGVDGVRGFGYTDYSILVCEYIPEYMYTFCAESELEFPINPFMARLFMDVDGAFPGGTPWGLHVDVAKNINDPGGPMKDSDWFSSPGSEIRTQFSYTESDAQLGAWFLDFNGRVVFYRHPRFSLEGILGYKYQKLTYEMFGVDGWVLYGNERMYYTEYEGINVLDYEITYSIPYVGMGTHIHPAQTWVIYTELSYSPKTSAKDLDDHLLRFKTSESDCSGKSLIGVLDFTWAPSHDGEGLSWFIGIGGDFIYTTTEGLQTQSWYGDDPITPDPEDDETGTSLPNIDTDIKRWSQEVYVRVGANL